MAIGAGGGIMAGPMGSPTGVQIPTSQRAAVTPTKTPNIEPVISDTGEDMATTQAKDVIADTGRLAQAVQNISPDAKDSLLNITKGQAEGMTQVLANLGISPEETNAVFSKVGIGTESGLIIPTREVLEDPEMVKQKIDQFVVAMSGKADEGMMTSNIPTGVEEATMDRRPAPAMV